MESINHRSLALARSRNRDRRVAATGISSQMVNEAYDVLEYKGPRAYDLILFQTTLPNVTVLSTTAFPAELSPPLLLLIIRSSIGGVLCFHGLPFTGSQHALFPEWLLAA